MDKEKKEKLLRLCNQVTKTIDSNTPISFSVTIEGDKIYGDVIDIKFNKYLYIRYNNAIYCDSEKPYKYIEGVFNLDYNDGKYYDIWDDYNGFSGEECISFCHMHPSHYGGYYQVDDGYNLAFYCFCGSIYDNYMKSKEWEEKRRSAYKRAGYTCEKCGKTGVTLYAHHITYSRLCHEKEEDLIVLCYDCHAKEHPSYR